MDWYTVWHRQSPLTDDESCVPFTHGLEPRTNTDIPRRSCICQFKCPKLNDHCPENSQWASGRVDDVFIKTLWILQWAFCVMSRLVHAPSSRPPSPKPSRVLLCATCVKGQCWRNVWNGFSRRCPEFIWENGLTPKTGCLWTADGGSFIVKAGFLLL